jgi:hypothetical protein
MNKSVSGESSGMAAILTVNRGLYSGSSGTM